MVEQVSQVLKIALRQRQTDQPLLHPSDRGGGSAARLDTSAFVRITCSMTDGYDCCQNALAERVTGILRMESLLQRPADLSQARTMVGESVWLYKECRWQQSLKCKTPDAVHRAFPVSRLGLEISPG
ncbi:integrase core domain-containing protein [Comamonas thiooxydans]|uniref:integrase core domain-containing protein n=1 Tax=Comamonas thiooxydans TaxID=363952 RepID=UPI0020CB8962|nr:integrase core domain-containing protein [Comamonas thiooxydans]